MLFCGLPRTGKTTAMLRLSNQLQCLSQKDSPIPSTGFEKPKTVAIYPKKPKDSVGVGEAEWKYEDLDEQGETLYSCILKSSFNSTSSPDMNASSQSSSSHAEEHPSLTSKQVDVASTGGTEKQSLLTSKSIPPSQSTASKERAVRELTSLVKVQRWEAVREKLKAIEDMTILHMMDCGGHPECSSF